MTEKYRHLIATVSISGDSWPVPLETIRNIVMTNSKKAGRKCEYEYSLVQHHHTITIECYGTKEQCDAIIKEVKAVIVAALPTAVTYEWLISCPEAYYQISGP